MAAKVLVVDDDRLICRLLADFFEDEGYDVRCAGDGLAALAEVERDLPDLVVTDLMMPRLDGAGLVARLVELGSGVPVIVMSAAHSRGAGVPATCFVEKPFDFDDLVDVVDRILSRSAS